MHTISRTSGAGLVSSGFGKRWHGFRKPLAVVSWVLRRLMTWQERAEQRHALAMLDDHQLKDIGLSRSQIICEISKPFWRD